MSLIERNSRKIARRKTYSLPDSKTVWRVVKGQRTGDDYHLLCRRGEDFVVFTFGLNFDLATQIPSDKFTCGMRSGKALFNNIVRRFK